MHHRLARESIEQSKKSILLLGPRQVGKSTLLKALGADLSINLADEAVYLEHAGNPALLRHLVEAKKAQTIVIDEVQRLPSLLNTVQALLDEVPRRRFLLTGSSARKLRRGGANLLPGRVHLHQMGPLVSAELSYKMDTSAVLSRGSLPGVLTLEPQAGRQLLSSYAATYLKEEIRAEALVRNLEAFARYLPVAAASAGQFLDFSKLARSARVSRHALHRFYDIFEDTLVGARLFPYPPMVASHQLVKHPKFYWFDVGVYNALLGNFTPSPDRVGALAEHLVFNQIRHSAWAKNKSVELFSFRTRGGAEIDFIVQLDGEVFPVEVKAAERVDESDVRQLKRFVAEVPAAKSSAVLAHLGERELKVDGLWCLPWQSALKHMGL